MFANYRTWKCNVAKPADFSEEAENPVNIDFGVSTELAPLHTARYPAPADVYICYPLCFHKIAPYSI